MQVNITKFTADALSAVKILNMLPYMLEVLVDLIYLSMSTLCCFMLQQHYISRDNIVLFTPLHLFDNFSY